MHFFFFKLYTPIVKEETTRTAAGWHLGWKESGRNRARYKDPVGIFARRWQLKRVAIARNSRSGVWGGAVRWMEEWVASAMDGRVASTWDGRLVARVVSVAPCLCCPAADPAAQTKGVAISLGINAIKGQESNGGG